MASQADKVALYALIRRESREGLPACQVRGKAQRGLIRPMQIIHRQQRRRPLRDPGGQPVQAMHDRKRILVT